MIPQYEPYLDHRELQQLADCIKSNWITGGPKVRVFEDRMKALTGAKHTVACCNGTMALYVGLKILGIGEGDSVIVPDFTFIASANSIVMAGATPLFCDVNIDSFCMSKETVREALALDTEDISLATKAIMPVGIYGNSPNMDGLSDTGLTMIEDVAQNIRVTWRDRHLGTFGDIGCMSFYADKTLTTGEGGMIFTDNDEYAEKAVRLLNQGRTGRGRYIHDTIGYNFRMTDLQAAIGLAQLDKLDEIVNLKKHHEELYRTLLADVEQVEFPVIDRRCFNVPFRHNVLVPDPEALSNYLMKKGIGNLRFFYPLHRQPCYNYRGLIDRHFPNTVAIYDRGLSLPSSARLTDNDIEYVCDRVKDFFGRSIG